VSVRIGTSIQVGTGHPLLAISGPCQIESRDHCFKIAEFLKTTTSKFPVSLVFKSSYDKANRTSLGGQRGLGIDEGLRILQEIRSTFDVPVLTDVHTEEQVEAARQVVDVLQIPAFLCRQTDLLLAAGRSGKAIHVKKGQFLSPADMQFAAEKIASTGNTNILLCERGTCFGYRDLVVDMRSLMVMRKTGYPVVYDATHSVQQMGGNGGSSGGSREYVQALARGAVAVGIDGLFFECHDKPDCAPSDGPCMLPLDQVPEFLDVICRLRAAVQP
jgi:2-dehydro-3-deoxyphosphooctonate aldolase (KDO 8-P synthase)